VTGIAALLSPSHGRPLENSKAAVPAFIALWDTGSLYIEYFRMRSERKKLLTSLLGGWHAGVVQSHQGRSTLARSLVSAGDIGAHSGALRTWSISSGSSPNGKQLVCQRPHRQSRSVGPSFAAGVHTSGACFQVEVEAASHTRVLQNAHNIRDRYPQQSQTSQTAQTAQTAQTVADVFADAEECDEAMEDLENVRKRVQAAKKLPPGCVPVSVRIKNATESAAQGLKAVVVFIVGVPGRMIRFYGQPREDRKACYSRWWGVVKSEAKHYWLGFKLLGKDTKIASRLVGKVLRGKALSRRERKQLTRTTADIFRLVPMMVFLVVPFMELLLPVALKLFPNMLPSTFEDKLKKEEDMKKGVGARLEIARFLQDTVAEMAGDMHTHRSGDTKTSAAELYSFMQRVRAGEHVDNSELLKFAKLFNDELTLDNLERVQLVGLCRFVGISPFGTDAFLKTRLRAHLLEIKQDDFEIQEEGIEMLTEEELRQACRARGMRTPFGEGAEKFMRQQLEEWLDWSLNRSLPSSLLLLSRISTFTVSASGSKTKPSASQMDVSSIRDTLSTMPEEVVEDVELFATVSADRSEEYEKKLELLEREEELIREEEDLVLDLNLPDVHSADDLHSYTAAEKAATAAAAAVVKEAAMSSFADVLDKESKEEREFKAAAAKEAKMQKILNAIAALASSSGVISEREAFMDLVEKEIERLQSSLGNKGGGMVFTKGQLNVDRGRIEEALGQRRLEDRIGSILKRVEKDLDDVETKIGDKFKLLDADNDGIISQEELKLAFGFLKEQLGEEELKSFMEELNKEGAVLSSGGISTNELLRSAYESDDEEEDEKSLKDETLNR
jgi:LETM1 and EF-hand domain-containing protein 1